MTEETKVAAETETPSLDEAAKVETPTGSPDPQETTPDPAALKADIAALREELKATEAKAKEAIEAHRRSQGTTDAVSKRLEKRIERIQAELENIVTSGMDEGQVRAWRLQRELEELASSRTTEVDVQREREEFATWSGPFLQEEGIPPTDPALNEVFNRLAASGKNAADWKIALTRAVAQVHKQRAEESEKKAKEREDKAREDERNKLKNEKRSGLGPLDGGGTPGGKGFLKMIEGMDPSSPEFQRIVDQAKAGRLRTLG